MGIPQCTRIFKVNACLKVYNVHFKHREFPDKDDIFWSLIIYYQELPFGKFQYDYKWNVSLIFHF